MPIHNTGYLAILVFGFDDMAEAVVGAVHENVLGKRLIISCCRMISDIRKLQVNVTAATWLFNKKRNCTKTTLGELTLTSLSSDILRRFDFVYSRPKLKLLFPSCAIINQRPLYPQSLRWPVSVLFYSILFSLQNCIASLAHSSGHTSSCRHRQ